MVGGRAGRAARELASERVSRSNTRRAHTDLILSRVAAHTPQSSPFSSHGAGRVGIVFGSSPSGQSSRVRRVPEGLLLECSDQGGQPECVLGVWRRVCDQRVVVRVQRLRRGRVRVPARRKRRSAVFVGRARVEHVPVVPGWVVRGHCRRDGVQAVRGRQKGEQRRESYRVRRL